MSKIHLNQSINLLTEERVGIEKIKKHPLIIHKQLIITMKKIGDYNSTKKKTVLIVFDDMIEDMESNKN